MAFTSITFMSLYCPYELPPMAEMLPPISNSHFLKIKYFLIKCSFLMFLLIVLFTHNHIEWHSYPLTFMSLYFPYELPPMAEMLPPISNSHFHGR